MKFDVFITKRILFCIVQLILGIYMIWQSKYKARRTVLIGGVLLIILSLWQLFDVLY